MQIFHLQKSNQDKATGPNAHWTLAILALKTAGSGSGWVRLEDPISTIKGSALTIFAGGHHSQAGTLFACLVNCIEIFKDFSDAHWGARRRGLHRGVWLGRALPPIELEVV